MQRFELESTCLSGQVRPPLYSFGLTQPLSCLGNLVVRASAFRVPPEQLFFPFCEKRVVQVSCVALFIYVGVGVFLHNKSLTKHL